MFTLPDTLPTSREELAALREEATSAFNEVYGDGQNVTAEDLQTLQTLSAAVDTIDQADNDLKNKEAAGALAAEFAAKNKTTEDTPEETPETAANEGEKPEENTEPEEQPEDTPRGDDDTTTGEEEQPEGTTNDNEGDTAVTASAKTRFANAAGHANPELPTRNVGFRLTTSAQNYETGVVDALRVATEFGNLAAGHSARVIGNNGVASTTFAYLDRDVPAEYTITDANDVGRAEQVLSFAADETNLKGGSLVAAGGWCAPSETIYDFLPTLQAADLLSLPEVTVTRGGLKFPKEPDFATIYKTFPGFQQIEVQAQANTEKTCVEIPCDQFEEMRLDVIGQCITSGILQNKAWPEQTAKYINEVMRAHQHRISAYKINKVVAGSTKVTTTLGFDPAAGSILNALALQAVDIRTKHRIPSSASLEGFAPVWAKEIMRSDMAFQQGVEVKNITDQQIQDWFTRRGINLQFVVDWQTEAIGAESAATAWPKTVQVVLYPAGTWVSAVEPVINLGINYDSTLLKTNKRVELFTEDGILVGKRGYESRVVTIPVTVEGLVGARNPKAEAAE